MNEVKRREASLEAESQGFGIGQIRFGNFNPGILSPLAFFEFAPRADEASDRVAGIEQARRQTAANVAGGSCYRKPSGLYCFHHSATRLSGFLQQADIESLGSGFLDELLIDRLVHPRRS